MLNIIQKIDITYRTWKFSKLREFGEAVTVLKYVIRSGKFPHGDAEYEEILNQEV